ncbi:MAG: class I SAM-dependent methyltransferase [Candidatus Magasanikbacteria bacterium]|nr:class I SAM-dependent methyltransferase [Candidatus Magasanikbacteria bacterium]
MVDFDSQKYWENRLREKYSLEGVGCLGFGEAYNKWLYRLRKASFISELMKLKQDRLNSHLLDIDSGTGFYIKIFQSLDFKKIVGVDIAGQAITGLRKEFPGLVFEQLDISQENASDFLNDKFDVITAMDVLFHITDDRRYEQTIKNIYNLLKPDGYFIFTDNFVHGEEIRFEHHVSRSLKRIESALIMSGFTIIRRRPVFLFMNYPVDTENKLLKFFFGRIIVPCVQRSEVCGKIVGACLYCLERVASKFIREDGPSTELMVCRKK